jgi:hypothetical protein
MNKANNNECLTSDLEKTIPLPHMSADTVYYKCQLMLWNTL